MVRSDSRANRYSRFSIRRKYGNDQDRHFVSRNLYYLIAFIRYLRVGFPRHYFSLGQIIIDDNDNSNITNPAILIRFSPPLLVGLFVGFSRLETVSRSPPSVRFQRLSCDLAGHSSS